MLATMERMLDMNYERYTICILLTFCVCWVMIMCKVMAVDVCRMFDVELIFLVTNYNYG